MQQQHEEQCRQDPPRAPLVEPGDAESVILEIVEQDRCYQISADDEKYVDTRNKTAFEWPETGMKNMTAVTASALRPSISARYLNGKDLL
ncbi:MAG: hypothetical protein R3D03_07835 [Geminicoccaceae bacterium]